jgi:hypothetical protein
MRDAADKNEEESELSDNEWKDLCQAILIKLFGTAYEVTSLASRWFRTDSCGPREANERIESYHARFKSGLDQVQWIRECFRKPIGSAWMTKKLQKFIDNLNSPWAQMLAVDMPETHSLQEILFEIQKMTRTTSLDDSVF